MTSVQVPTSDSFIELTRKDHNLNPRTLRVEILCPGFVMTDPQALVDALAELFPDVKPSPPKPKVGDRVRAPMEGMGDVRAIDAEWVWVRLDKYQGPGDAPHLYHRSILTVVERGAS